MGERTYRMSGIVLKKTKLGDKDLIVSFLNQDGALVQGVAKGARKPGGSFAARLELFSCVDVMLAQGRSLDVVCEARLRDSVDGIDWTLERTSCAAPLAELLTAASQPDLEQSRVFDIARAAFKRIGSTGVSDAAALSLCAASLWKVMAQIGFRPSFTTCVLCGRVLDTVSDHADRSLAVNDGGAVCGFCRRPADAIVVKAGILRWCDALIASRFDDIVSWDVSPATSFEVLQVARQWARAHVGKGLKSLDFLFTSGLFV